MLRKSKEWSCPFCSTYLKIIDEKERAVLKYDEHKLVEKTG